MHGAVIDISSAVTDIVPGALAEATPSVDASLMHAAQRGNTDLIESLVRQGASVNVVGEHETSALMPTAYGGHAATVQVLLRNGVEYKYTG